MSLGNRTDGLQRHVAATQRPVRHANPCTVSIPSMTTTTPCNTPTASVTAWPNVPKAIGTTVQHSTHSTGAAASEGMNKVHQQYPSTGARVVPRLCSGTTCVTSNLCISHQHHQQTIVDNKPGKTDQHTAAASYGQSHTCLYKVTQTSHPPSRKTPSLNGIITTLQAAGDCRQADRQALKPQAGSAAAAPSVGR